MRSAAILAVGVLAATATAQLTNVLPTSANGVAGITAERVIREGEIAQEILNLIEEDQDIAVLVLAAGTGSDGPGPLVSSLSKTAGQYPIPVAIVPGHLGDADIDALS